jgi:hypothetical protein
VPSSAGTPSLLVLGVSTPWPAVVAAVAVVTAIALWGLFRRGSIADRARHDYDDEDEGRAAPGGA